MSGGAGLSARAERLMAVARAALAAAGRRLGELRAELHRLNTVGIDEDAPPDGRRARARLVRRALAERNSGRNSCC